MDYIIAALEKKVDKNDSRIDGMQTTMSRIEGALGRIEATIPHLATSERLTAIEGAAKLADQKQRNWILASAVTVLVAVTGFGWAIVVRTAPAAMREAVSADAAPQPAPVLQAPPQQ